MKKKGGGELIEGFIKKVLDATSDLDQDYKKEIGKMQRATRKIKESPFYPMFITCMQTFQSLLVKEIENENNNPSNP